MERDIMSITKVTAYGEFLNNTKSLDDNLEIDLNDGTREKHRFVKIKRFVRAAYRFAEGIIGYMLFANGLVIGFGVILTLLYVALCPEGEIPPEQIRNCQMMLKNLIKCGFFMAGGAGIVIDSNEGMEEIERERYESTVNPEEEVYEVNNTQVGGINR